MGKSQGERNTGGQPLKPTGVINTGENMLTFNTMLVLYLDSFGFGVTHIQLEPRTVET